MKYCTHCGAKLDDNAKFCSECGRKTGGNGGWNNKKTGIVIGIVAAVIAVALIFFFVAKGNSSDKISLEKPLELTKENLAGTWEMKDGKDKTTIVFTDKAVTVDSSKLENSKELKDGTYEISKDTIKLTFKPKKDKVVIIETKAGVNKDSLQLITQDKDYKALNGIYTKAAEKKETAKEQKKEEKKEEPAEEKKEESNNNQEDINQKVMTTYDGLLGETQSVAHGFGDFNGDGVTDIVLKFGTCEADYKYLFYTYRPGSDYKTDTMGSLGGDHSGIFMYNGNTYLFWGHMGSQTIYKLNFSNGQVTSSEVGTVSAGPHNGLTPDQINVFKEVGIPEDQVTWVIPY